MASNNTATVPPASSPPPVSLPPSSSPPPPSSAPPASSPPPKSSAAAPPPPPPASTQVVVTAAPSPPITEIQTSIIISNGTPTPVVVTLVTTPPAQARPTSTNAGTNVSPSSTNATELQNARKMHQSGLSTGGKTAIAVVIPVVAVALLLLGALFFWRKRKQRKSNEDERRKEVEEYGFNPNHDPTLPAVGMVEDDSGYRGWGNTQTSSNRKASTTLTSGMTYSDSNSNPGGYANPNSPNHGTYPEANLQDPLMKERGQVMDSDGIGALGAVGVAVAPKSNQRTSGVHRGPSNASSSYSAGNYSDNSGDYPGMTANHGHDVNNDNQGYYQPSPYGNHDPYAAPPQPVIRDVSARRNTRIENPSVFPQQGNSGIAQNF